MMKIDLTCPIEAWRVELPTEEKRSCEVTLFNLSSMQVVSVEVTLMLSTADGEETARITHRGRMLNGAPGKTFRMTVPVEQPIRPQTYEITVEKVWYDNAAVWRRDKEQVITYEPNNLHRSPELTQLREIAGGMASGYPSQQDGVWVCVCGRPNPDSMERCARCHQDKAEVFFRYSREAIEAAARQRQAELDAVSRAAREQTGRIQAAREQEYLYSRKRRNRVLRVLAVLLVLLAAAYGVVFHGIPYAQYNQAEQALKARDYAQAQTGFETLAAYGYRDASERVKESRYLSAASLITDTDLLADASAQADESVEPTEAEVIAARTELTA